MRSRTGRRLDAAEDHAGYERAALHPRTAADSVLDHAAKAIEIEDVELRVTELERAAEMAKSTRN